MDAKQKAYSEWLVVRCQQGDRSALEKLLALWKSRYFTFARYRLDDKDAAQDVLQDALLAICRNLHRLSDPGSFPRWSFTIVERRCVDWQRTRIRDRERLARGYEADAHIANSQANPIAEAVDAKMDSERMLALLDSELRALLRLYYLEEMSIGDIAEVLDLAVGTVKSRLFYARKKLQEKLESEQEKPQ